MSSYFKCLIYKITLKVHKFVVHNLVNFVFFAYLCIRNQVKRNSNGKGILESWGRGIGTMVDECERVGLPAPEFNTDGNFVWVVFKYNRNSVVVTPQLPHSYPTVTPQLMKVITVIRDNMMAAKEIMECIKLKDKTYFLDKYLYPAMEEGYVEQLYPENPKHPKQKYMLTEKGKALLK